MLELFAIAVLGVVAGIASGGLAMTVARVLLNKRNLAFNLKQSQIALFLACSAVFGGAIAYTSDTIPQAAYLFMLLIAAGTLVVTDMLHRVIPNQVVLALIAIKLAMGIPTLLGAEGFPTFSILSSCAGFLACVVIFSLPALFKNSVGAGDIKLAAAVGFCLGLEGSLFAIALMGALVLAYVVLQRRMPVISMIREMVPMGPFLGTAMLVVLVAGPLTALP